jgi:hypothetical protein
MESRREPFISPKALRSISPASVLRCEFISGRTALTLASGHIRRLIFNEEVQAVGKRFQMNHPEYIPQCHVICC